MATIPDLPFVDPASLDFTQCVADIHKIREINPHRHEVEMLTAVTHINEQERFIAGYKDAKETDFWVRGHMPGFPLMPGVMMIEAAAQLCGFYLKYMGIIKDATLGLAGVEMAKFKRMVRPAIGSSSSATASRWIADCPRFMSSGMSIMKKHSVRSSSARR